MKRVMFRAKIFFKLFKCWLKRIVQKHGSVSCQVCKKVAIAHVTYGLYSEYKKGRPHHELDVCSKHLTELGKKCKPAVATLLLHFIIKPV